MLFSYFNLCSEEYLFYNAGYIDRDVQRGMSYQYRARAVDASGTEGTPTAVKDVTFNP